MAVQASQSSIRRTLTHLAPTVNQMQSQASIFADPTAQTRLNFAASLQKQNLIKNEMGLMGVSRRSFFGKSKNEKEEMAKEEKEEPKEEEEKPAEEQQTEAPEETETKEESSEKESTTTSSESSEENEPENAPKSEKKSE